MKKINTLVLMILCFSFMVFSKAEAQNDREIAIVRKFKPEVMLQNMSADKSFLLDLKENKGEKLYSGDSLLTLEDGFALVIFMDASVAKVKPGTLLIINGEVSTTSKEMSTRINLSKGELFLNVEPQGNNDFEVATSQSLASVKGTDFGSRSDGYVWVEEGQVDVTALNSGQTVSLFEKMFAQVDPDGNNVDSGMLSQEELDALGEGYDKIESDYVEKQIILKFRDRNGQIREITINVFEEGKN